MFRRYCTLTVLASAALAVAAQTSAATLYKWTDESGTTHFSERPPAGVTQFEKVTSHYLPGNSPVPAPEAASGAPEAENNEAEASAQTSAQPKPASRERCDKARKNLDALTSFARIRIEENGEMRFLSEDEITTRRMETQAILDDECGF